MVSFTNTQFYCYYAKSAINNTETNRFSYVLIKFTKTGGGPGLAQRLQIPFSKPPKPEVMETRKK